MTWASTRARSDFKERRDTRLFTVIGFPHAENVAHRRDPRRVPNHNDPTFQSAKTDDSCFTVVLSGIFHFDSNAREDPFSVSKVETAICQGLGSFDWIECYAQAVIVYTETKGFNRGRWGILPGGLPNVVSTIEVACGSFKLLDGDNMKGSLFAGGCQRTLRSRGLIQRRY
jgi:hypothetical protein